ncbi:hypothetical protein [Piscinibacter koreensis]|uniref:Carboxypeptidase regulatory-like domain-containing protein n=1 Tax=Piscinibacter koreensis TaxID=2742824 RepID=A0A7Y6NJF3_9BURK|nr:hypothetical protein [Schlegelella koreensis]NUZ04283.1 hypothetical protein [Schlegelella koreensis]
MRPLAPQLLVAALLAASALAARAQPASDPGAPPPPTVQRAGNIEYVNGGGGTETRDAIARLEPGFTLKVVFSEATGAFTVADRLAIRGNGGEVLSIANAGPWVLVKLPVGRYTLDASAGGQTQQKTVTVGNKLQTVNWSWPAAAKPAR